jgi:hypothetical protein
MICSRMAWKVVLRTAVARAAQFTSYCQFQKLVSRICTQTTGITDGPQDLYSRIPVLGSLVIEFHKMIKVRGLIPLPKNDVQFC